MSSVDELDCGLLGLQPIKCEFKDGKLLSIYFVWDHEKTKNLMVDLCRLDIEDIERAHAALDSRLQDPLYLAKMKAEDDMIAQDHYEDHG